MILRLLRHAAPAALALALVSTARAADAPALRDTALINQYAQTHRFRLGRPNAITPLADGHTVLFLRSGPRSPVQDLWEWDAATGQERTVITAEAILRGAAEQLTPEERARRERQRSAARGIASFAVTDDGARLLVPLSGRLFVVERASGATRELKSDGPPAEDPILSPDGARVACERDGDLYVTDLASGAERRLTTRSSDDVSNGSAEFVAQEEMGRQHGTWWSPDSRRLAFERADVKDVPRFHILDPAHPDAEPQAWPYPRPGTPNAVVTLGITSADSGAVIWVQWDRARWPYLAAVTWTEHAPLTIVVQSRDQREEAVLAVDDATGATRELVIERDEAWVNLDPGLPRWLPDGSAFLWSSEHAGAWELERHDRDGVLEHVLVPAGLGYRGFVDLDEKRGEAWVKAGTDPTETQLYRVRVDGRGAPEQVTKEHALHEAAFGRGDGLWVETIDPLAGDRQLVVRRRDGRTVGTLRGVDERPEVTPRVTLLTVGAQGFRAALVKPADFDSTQHYPVVVDVYGGPHAQMVQAAASRYVIAQWLANEGFIVVSFDGRGTPARGRAWERAIRGDLAGPMLDDQTAGLAALGARIPQMDMKRVGVWGWSFGGYATCMAVLRRPDVFACGVAVAPVTDWHDYDTHYTERYLGLLPADSAAYERSSVLAYAGDLQRPLLVIHGSADDNVYFIHSLRLSDALTRAGRHAEVLPMIGQAHGVNDPTLNERVYARLATYLKEHLGAPR